MHPLVIAPAAQRDIESILAWTHDHFGEAARLRYEALLIQAIVDVASRPDLPGSEARAEIFAAARTYHFLHSRNRVASKTDRVKRPRHFLLYRNRADGAVEIARVLHDSMDLSRHLADVYRSSGAADE